MAPCREFSFFYFMLESIVKLVFKVGGLNDFGLIRAPVLFSKLFDMPIWFIRSALRWLVLLLLGLE